MRGWILAGIRRQPGPLVGTVVAAATAAALTAGAVSIAAADTTAPAGRLAGASVVVAGGDVANLDAPLERVNGQALGGGRPSTSA